MSGKRNADGRDRQKLSADPHQAPAAMTQVMKAWDQLTEEEYLTWRVAAKERRREGVNYFKSVNLRRLLRGDELARLPPPSEAFNAQRVLKGLKIRNWSGQITIELLLRRVLDQPMTVWASRPCNRGAGGPGKCPRLGWLQPRATLVRDITKLYFQKHRSYLIANQVQIVGKRIFVRLRYERDEGANLYEQVEAVVPPPEVEKRKKP